MSDSTRWNDRYRTGDTPWDTGRPSSELQRVLGESALKPCPAVELGCGTGANCVWLAQRGFDVTGIDLSPLAIDQAQARARAAGLAVRFVVGEVVQLPADLTGKFGFFFDRGCYHAVRRDNVQGYLATISRITRPGALGLVLAGNAREPHDPGPPVVTEEQIRAELGSLFDITQLREFYFDEAMSCDVRFLGWSCLLRRREI